MTTIIAAEFDGGVIIGADSRPIEGDFVVIDFLKNFDHVTLEAKRFENENDLEKATVVYVANLVSSFITDLEQQSNSYIVAGWDEVRGAQVYHIFQDGFIHCKKVALFGTSSHLLSGYVQDAYTENMTENACVKFVEEAVRLCFKEDICSGGVVKIFKCAKQGSYGKIIYPTPNGELIYPLS